VQGSVLEQRFCTVEEAAKTVWISQEMANLLSVFSLFFTKSNPSVTAFTCVDNFPSPTNLSLELDLVCVRLL
jgi:hypothetical protein